MTTPDICERLKSAAASIPRSPVIMPLLLEAANLIESQRSYIKLHAGDCLSLDGEIRMYRDQLEEADAYLERLRGEAAAREWRGIESAPKDGLQGEMVERAARSLCPIDPDSTHEFIAQGRWYRAGYPHWQSWVPDAIAVLKSAFSVGEK